MDPTIIGITVAFTTIITMFSSSLSIIMSKCNSNEIDDDKDLSTINSIVIIEPYQDSNVGTDADYIDVAKLQEENGDDDDEDNENGNDTSY
jgi:hypothetical protein